MLFNNYKAVISILYYLLGKNNFAITGGLADYNHIKKDILINDIDIIITNDKVLERLNPYFKIVKSREINEESIPHIKRIYVYNMLAIKIEIYVNEEFREIEKHNFLNMNLNFVSIEGRKKELLSFVNLSKKQKNMDRIIKYNKKLRRYNSVE